MIKAIRFSAILALVLLAAACSYAAEVKNVELSYQDGQIQARIAVDGTIRYTHQTEVAKDGKPFRVIVDVIAATHELGAKKFSNLPNCVVSDLRTSQFAVSPEKVVRLVFDMKQEVFYQISSDKDYIIVNFPDKDSKPFAAWSSITVVEALKEATTPSKPMASVEVSKAEVPTEPAATKTTMELNNSIEQDRQKSLASKPDDASVETSSDNRIVSVKPNVTPPPSLSAETKDMVPEVDESSPQDSEQAKADKSAASSLSNDLKYSPAIPPQKPEDPSIKGESAKSKPTGDNEKQEVKEPTSMKGEPKKQTPPAYVTPKPVLAQTPAKESKVVANEPAKKKVAAVEKSKVEEPESKSLAKAPQGDTKEKKPVAKAEVDESKKKPTAASKGEASKTNSGAVATKEDSSIKSTSRFRRSAADRKIQGTMVAEFPKRLVIKYHSRSQRDPFATLVDETKVSNSPTQRQVPNVEGLKLVGVIEADNNKNQALFEDKQGYGYILKSGDKVQKGYVLRVESNRVYFQIFEYGWSRTIALNLEDN